MRRTAFVSTQLVMNAYAKDAIRGTDFEPRDPGARRRR